jgi:hypothetical protein
MRTDSMATAVLSQPASRVSFTLAHVNPPKKKKFRLKMKENFAISLSPFCYAQLELTKKFEAFRDFEKTRE